MNPSQKQNIFNFVKLLLIISFLTFHFHTVFKSLNHVQTGKMGHMFLKHNSDVGDLLYEMKENPNKLIELYKKSWEEGNKIENACFEILNETQSTSYQYLILNNGILALLAGAYLFSSKAKSDPQQIQKQPHSWSTEGG